MELRSLGYRTELLVHGFENRIEDRGDYIFVQTLGNPGFFWGNLLIFSRPPTKADIDEWPRIFAREFAHEPRVKHCTLAWDSPDAEKGAGQSFVDAGFKWEESLVLTASNVRPPPKVNRDIVVRPLETDSDWESSLQNQLTARPAHLEEKRFEVFARARQDRYRRMTLAGLGHWYGAFLDRTIVGDLGIFVRDGLGRFQNVITHTDYRRQGIAGMLVWRAAAHAFANLGAEKLVMIADEGDHPAKIYRSVGFEVVERTIGVYRWPKEDEAPSAERIEK